MKIHTFTVVVGTKACNMACPYCVSKMTPDAGLGKSPVPNYRNFDIACRFAKMSGVTTVLFTGKGEPTLYPDLLTAYLSQVDRHDAFPFRELQTNGVLLDPCYDKNYLEKAEEWYKLGMTLICISVAHYDPGKNNKLLQPSFDGFNYWRAVNALHELGFSVRINCTLVREGIDTPQKLDALRDECRRYGVEQITVRMVTKPDESQNEEVADWVRNHQFPDEWVAEHILSTGGVELLNLPHGATVFDWRGQNICTSTCLTGTTDRDDIRQLIFFSNGSLRYDWRYEGAIIL